MLKVIRANPKKSAVIGAAMIAAAASAGLPDLKQSEGRVLRSYRDIVGVWTACDGETKGIGPNMVFTPAECDEMTIRRFTGFVASVAACAERPMNRMRLAAFGLLAYNIGESAACRSTAMRLHNSGAPKEEVCRWFLAFNKAGGRVIRGLELRRERERRMCMRDD